VKPQQLSSIEPKFLNSTLQQPQANVKLTQCEHRMLFLSPGMVDWLQTLLHWCDNNAAFIVDVSRVYANSLPQKIGEKQNQSVHTHRIFENFQSDT